MRTADSSTDIRPITDEEIAWAVDHEACYEAGAADSLFGTTSGAKPRKALQFAVPAAMVIIVVAAAVALAA